MDNINDLLKDYSNRHGLGESLPAARIVELANEVSDGKYRAVSYRNSRLKVEVQAGPELFFLKQDEGVIVDKINKKIGEKKVEKLVIRGV